jgi:hypothetical protein
MSKKSMTGVILTLLGSLAIGVVASLVFLNVFKSSIPPAALSTMTQKLTPALFVMIGVGLGFVIALWTLVCAMITKKFGTAKS